MNEVAEDENVNRKSRTCDTYIPEEAFNRERYLDGVRERDRVS